LPILRQPFAAACWSLLALSHNVGAAFYDLIFCFVTLAFPDPRSPVARRNAREPALQLSTWGGVHPHSRIHLPQADMLGPLGAKRDFSGLKDHGLSAQRDATVCHGVNVTLLLANPVIQRGIVKIPATAPHATFKAGATTEVIALSRWMAPLIF